MKHNKIINFFLFVLFIGMGTNVGSTNADSLPFSVEPILPDNQHADVSSYISVFAKDKTLNQEFSFKITNHSNQKQEIKVTVVDAYTSPNGVIQYEKDETANSKITNEKYKLSNYLEAENDVMTLKGNEVKTISARMDVEAMEGVLLGGVSFSTIEADDGQEEAPGNFQINNEINVIIGVMASFSTDKDASFIVEEPVIDPMPSYYAIRLPITLDVPLLISDAEIHYQVMYKDEELFENQKDFSFAPYTKTNIALPFEHDEIMKNENYTLKGELVFENSKGNKEKKEFEQTFQYKKGQSEENVEGNTLTAPIEKSGFPFWTVIVIPLILFLIGVPVAARILADRRRG